MAATSSTCRSPFCNTNVPGTVAVCPKCGTKTMSSRRVVVLGWIMLVIGVLMFGGVGLLLKNLYYSFTHPGVRMPDGSTFTGTLEQGWAAIRLFLGLLAFGMLAMVTGLFQIVTGRRSLILAGGTIVFVVAIWFATQNMIRPGGVFGD